MNDHKYVTYIYTTHQNMEHTQKWNKSNNTQIHKMKVIIVWKMILYYQTNWTNNIPFRLIVDDCYDNRVEDNPYINGLT